jgi:hypothetical protein
MMAKSERAKSIDKLIGSTVRDIRSSLKTRGITVSEVDGPSETDMHLRGLQELQAIHAALKADDDAKAPLTAGSDFTATAKDAKGSK